MGVCDDYGQAKVDQTTWIAGNTNLRLTAKIYIGMSGVPGHIFYIEERLDNGRWKIVASFENVSKLIAMKEFDKHILRQEEESQKNISVTMPKKLFDSVLNHLYHTGGHEMAFQLEHAISVATIDSKTETIKEVIEKLKSIV